MAAPDAANAMLNNATLIVDNEMVKRRTATRRQPKIAQPTIGRSHSSSLRCRPFGERRNR
ncbi:hypothetical protein ACWEK5_34760 [Rhodococcus koreensis]